MARGLTKSNISTVEFITTLCNLLLSFHHYSVALCCAGGIFLHILSFTSTCKASALFISLTETYIQRELHRKCVALYCQRLRVLSVAISNMTLTLRLRKASFFFPVLYYRNIEHIIISGLQFFHIDLSEYSAQV